jgi:predicted SprT family Zn-dependent metalloprotease
MRHYFKPVLFILGLLLFTFSCEKELINDTQPIEQQSKPKIRLNTGSDVSIKATNFLKQKTSNTLNVAFIKGRLTLASNNFMSRESSMGTVDTSKEIVVENEYNTKHTFALQNTQSSNILVNVIVVETQDVIYEYFKVYHFEGKIPYDKHKTIDLSQFTGRIETYNSSGNITGVIVLNNGITSGSGGDSTPCPDDDDVWDGWDDFWENLNDNDGSSGGGTNNDGSANNNDSDDSNSNDGGTSTSSGGGDAEIENVDGCDIYYVDSDGDRWETDEWSPSDGTESCCMYLIVNCGSGNYSSTMARNAEDEDPCADGPVAILIGIEDLKNEIQECLGNSFTSDWFNSDNYSYSIYLNLHNYLITESECSDDAKEVVEDIMNELETEDCVIIPTTTNLEDIAADFDLSLFGDSPSPAVQLNHTAIKAEYEQKLANDGNLIAVNYLISTYSMESFGVNNINIEYTILFQDSVPEGDAVTLNGYNASTGVLTSSQITFENSLLSNYDFGYLTRAIKHELYHVLQGQAYGAYNISNVAREFDAYYSSIFAFRGLPKINNSAQLIQLAKWLEDNWNQMSTSEKSESQSKYNKAKTYFPNICKN